jgi:hypothetical protein
MKRSAPMQRTPMKRGTPPAKREAKVYEVHTPKPARARDVRMTAVDSHAHVSVPKTPNDVDHAIRQSARNEACTVRIPGVCNFDRETTVWSHAPFGAAGKAMGLKALEIAGCYICSSCHDVVDMRASAPAGMNRNQVLVEWFYGHLRSLVILRQKGLA